MGHKEVNPEKCKELQDQIITLTRELAVVQKQLGASEERLNELKEAIVFNNDSIDKLKELKEKEGSIKETTAEDIVALY